ncbi:hypothetical protein ACFOWM_01810 [Ferruginibacter yonginensis]|uniref:Uncharacterized protein n=1 Tax=Ferruginibacter yonginensis TaxID=1310416 RepID=A0ABV8QPR0_9BACT
MSATLQIINQIFELQQKINSTTDAAHYERNFNRLFSIFEEDGYIIQNPTNEVYSPTRTDCEASITGDIASKMIITKTLKPIIYQKAAGNIQLLQKAIVLVEKNNY